ncbi:MAG TPA: hypothetical protein VKU83_08710 [Puia sp.]|nr:hypothetical protein [Puia sp.]
MKRGVILSLTCAMVTVLPACVKHLDIGEIVQHDIVKSCPILQMWSVDPSKPDTTGAEVVVHYNFAGNPVEMLNIKGSGYRQDFHFRYDRSNRLTDFLMNPSISPVAPAALEWHTYTYPSRRMVVDSVYGENDPAGITAPRPNADAFAGVVTHFLDDEGRIIKDEGNWYGAYTDTSYFQYDAWGDMVRPGVMYDNKYNPYLTNDVWRFVYEDYSVNNPLQGTIGPPLIIFQYDARGLPQLLGGFGDVWLFRYEFAPGLQIIYGCDQGQGNTVSKAE